jgi:hypothetical protein
MKDSETNVYGQPNKPAKSDEESRRTKPALAPGLKIGGYVLVEKLRAGSAV